MNLYDGGNLLLDGLPQSELAVIRPRLRVTDLPSGEVLYAGAALTDMADVYFPMTCVTSMIALMSTGETVEAGTVGCEGLAGYHVVFGTRRMLERWICQVPGYAAAIAVDDLWTLLPNSPQLLIALLLYGQALLSALSQSVACNSLHSVAERCAKWLLLTHDRAQADQFQLTQEFLATMLGVRRSGVSLVASTLAQAGLLRYVRGRVSILDRVGLEGASCECYRNITTEYQRLMSTGIDASKRRHGWFERITAESAFEAPLLQ